MRILAIVVLVCTLLSIGCRNEKSGYDAGIAAYERGHYAVALSNFESMAMKGDPVAQYRLAFMYRNGKGIRADEDEAMYWYTESAKQDYAPAQNNLAVMYIHQAKEARIKIDEGKTTPDVIEDYQNNSNKAMQWFQKAAAKRENNHVPQYSSIVLSVPQYNIALIEYENAVLFDVLNSKKSKFLKFLPEDSEDANVQDLLKIVKNSHSQSVKAYETSVYWFTEAANNGFDRAQYELANRYYHGEGVEKNLTETERWVKAVEWYTKAKNYAPAQNALAKMYAEGKGVEKDPTKAVKLYKKAARSNNAEAQFNLAEMYKAGEGIDENLAETERWELVVKWYTKAANKDHGAAENNLAKIYTEGKSIFKNPEKAVRLFFKAAQQGHPVAQANIGLKFETGWYNSKTERYEVPQDDEEAYYWYSLALRDPIKLDKLATAENYADTVTEWLEAVENKLKEDEKNKIQARVDNWKPRILHTSGTGFYIDKKHILTNAHVAREEEVLHDGSKKWHEFDELRMGYRYISEKPEEPGTKPMDHDVDLALLLDESERDNMYTATFRSDPVYRGEKISLFGYPLSFNLSYEGNATSGDVSGLSGPIESNLPHNLFQHTAPQQGGNSGGPVFDSDGNVVGVSVSGMDPGLYREDGIIKVAGVDNISFAIKFDIIKKFLTGNKISINPVPKNAEDLDEVIDLNRISTKAAKFTKPILCFKNRDFIFFPMVQLGIDDYSPNYKVKLEGVGNLEKETTDASGGVSYTLRVTNAGNTNDKVRFATSGDATATVDPTSVSVNYNDSQEVTLKISGTALTKAGNYEVKVTATSQGDSTKTAEITTTTTILP